MTAGMVISAYQLAGELLLHPDDRDTRLVSELRAILAEAPIEIVGPLGRFLEDPLALSRDEYVQTLELAPPCPLYLGAHLFDEPTTCRNVGSSPRNAYMVELVGIYRHFGFELSARELPDYVPVVADFLALSFGHDERDRIGLRRRLLERLVRPALQPLRAALEKLQSPYALVVSALAATIEIDLARLSDRPAWSPSDHTEVPPRPLPFVSASTGGARRRAASAHEGVRS